MEIQGKIGSKTLLQEGLKIYFGRGLGLDSNDRTVSRRHILFQLRTHNQKDETRARFEVIGKNPIWVYNNRSGEIRVYRRFERGEMESGDMFCCSAKKPVWLTMKSIEFEGEDDNGMKRETGFDNELAESLQSSRGLTGIEDLELESGDKTNIDPVKEFGFVLMGHEFDCYPKRMIRDTKNWDWFLEEPGEESEDDERKRKKGVRRKRKKGEGNDDEDWTGESEEDAELITKLRKVQIPKYSTRSKERDKHIKDTRVSKSSGQKDTTRMNEKYNDDEEEDEDDNTLGGFIVDDEDVGQEEISDEEEEDFDDEEE